MKKDDFIYFANQYYEFRNQFHNNINNSRHIIQSTCYLIDESWIQNLDFCFNKFNKREYSYQNIIPFPKENPRFINDFSTAVTYIKINKNFKIISQQLIDLLYERKDIIRSNVIYYAGNNRLIIEIMDNDKNNALFFIDPLNSFRSNSDIFIILKNNISNIYQDLISLDNVEYEININPKYNQYFIPFVKFIKKNYDITFPFQPKDFNENLNQRLDNKEPLNNNSRSNSKDNVKKKKNVKIKISSPADNENMSNYKNNPNKLNGPKDNENNEIIFNNKKHNSPSKSNHDKDFSSFSTDNSNQNDSNKNQHTKAKSKCKNVRRNPNNIIYGGKLVDERSGQNNSSTLNNSSDTDSNNNSIINEEYKSKPDNFMNYINSLENRINFLESEVNNKDNIIKILQNKDKKDELAKNKEFQKLLGLKENEIMHYKKQLDILQKEIHSQKSENSSINKNFVNMGRNIEFLKTENENLRSNIKSLNSDNNNLRQENIKIKFNLNQKLEMYNQYKNKTQKIIINLKYKIKENEFFISKNKNTFNINEEELNKKIKEVNKKEKEINNKIAFLEDKENLIEEENKKFELNKKLNNDLILKNKQLEKEISNKENIYNNFFNDNILNLSGSRDNKEEPLNLYKKPTLVGLNNFGATCFMNSTLQCLSQTKGLTNYFLNGKNEENIIDNNIALKNKNDLQLSPVYLELIKILWKIDGEKSFSPNAFMNVINKMNPLFKTGQVGDAKDFIIFVLEQLHKELKKTVNKNKSQNLIPLNQYDKNNAFNYFFNDFQKECSIISDIFFGFTEVKTECLNCKNKYNSQGINNPICYNYEIFNCLIFSLEEVKYMKNNLFQNNKIQNNNNTISISDCFNYNQKSDYFTEYIKIYCNNCKQLFDSIYTSKIFISPNVLVLIFNRDKGKIYDTKLDFSETIDITHFVQLRDCPKLIYNLYGVITHIGQSGQNPHFVASCKSPIDNKWYRYNDAIVNPIINLQKEVIEFRTPYILFYQKNNF